MPSVPVSESVSGSVSAVSGSSSGAIEASKTHSIEWLTAAFREVEAEASGLAAADIREVDTDVPVYASTLLTRLAKFEDMRPLMLHHRCPMWPLDNLERYAVVASDANATKPNRGANPAHRELLAASSTHIATCKTEIGILIARGWVEASVLEGLPTHKSYRNNSVSLMRCALVLQEHREHLAATQSKITQEDIAQYIDIAERLSRHSVQRQLSEEEPNGEMASRTFTLLDMAVDELRAALTYVFRKTPEKVDLYFPKKPKKPSTTKTKKADTKDAKAKEEQQPEKAPTNKPQTSVGNAQSPTPSANGNVRAPEVRNEDRAAE